MNETLSASVGVSYEQEERQLYEVARQGNALYQMKQSPGYEILSDTLETLRTQAVDQLVRTLPGDNDKILAAHAVAYSVTQTIDNLRNAIDGAINRAKEVPAALEELKLLKDLNPQQI